ncbi:hypothetical protein [Rhodococcus sp. NPDC058514]|uniref:hypothetical protein n=1 Tax=Rhodococcus sp. NPDC058514 TaxID=3346532 RepID=UPI003649AD24
MKSKDRVFLLGAAFVWSVGILAALHYEGDPSWIDRLPAVSGSDGILWQVQTTFLSVGDAGLAIAAQLFAETPLAIGASRSRVLEQVHAGWTVGVGLTANAVIAVETIWLPSELGALGIALVWFVPTVALLVRSYVELMRLFGRPSQLDEVVRASLIETLTSRMETVSRDYAEARRRLDDLFESSPSVAGDRRSAVTLHIPVPHDGLVVKAIKPRVVRRAISSIGPRPVKGGAGDGGPRKDETGDLYAPPQVVLDVEPGDRTRIGETAFRIWTPQELDLDTQNRLIRQLQSSIEFESPGSVTLDEETDREIANLKDSVGTSLRSGAYGTAERALELLGQVVRGVWTARQAISDSPRRSSFTRRDWLYHSIGDVEQDALLSPRACGLFVDQAMTRALEAARTGSMEYVDECLRSFTRLWSDVIRSGNPEFDLMLARILTCVQNLAEYAFATEEQRDELQPRTVWAMVELVKLALDMKKPETARLAAVELNGLFKFDQTGGTARANVTSGQLVLSGWLGYLADKGDDRDPSDPELSALVTPRGTRSEILAARALAERGATPFSRWNWWETPTSASVHVQRVELPYYIERAELVALASSPGPLPPATDQETASEYKRLRRLLDEAGRELSTKELSLNDMLTVEVDKWDAAELGRLAR